MTVPRNVTISLPHVPFVFSTVWCILVLELIFEFAIRPSNYWQLIQSDKAYTPSTARHINAFHLFFETIALLLFLPQIPCVFFDDCGESIPGGLVSASLNAVIGDSMNVSASGRIIIGLSFLRTFSLVRHWKQMWINNTFKGTHSSENRKYFWSRNVRVSEPAF